MLVVKESLSQSEAEAWTQFMAHASRPPSYCFSSLTAWDHLRSECFVASNDTIKIEKQTFALTYLSSGGEVLSQALGYAIKLPRSIWCTLDIYGLIVKDYDEVQLRELLSQIVLLANRMNAISLRFVRTNLLEEDAVNFNNLLLKMGFVEQHPERSWVQTGIVDISQSPELVLASFRESTRRWIRKGRQAGMSVILGNGLDDIHSFYQLFLEMYERKAKSMGVPSIMLLESMRSRLMIGRAFSSDGVLLAGAALLEDGITARYLWGASITRPEGASQLVHYECMNWARQQGLKYYDLGGIPIDPADPLMKGIKQFKQGFRGDLVKSPNPQTLVLKPLIHKSLGFAKRVAAIMR